MDEFYHEITGAGKPMEKAGVKAWCAAVAAELEENILPYWFNVESGNGFWGGLRGNRVPMEDSPISLIMVTRLLWTYSRAYAKDRNEAHLAFAKRAYDYLIDRFEDREFGGYYWLLDPRGVPLETKKQTYGQAFAIYALSEYHLASGDPKSLERAMKLFSMLEERTYSAASDGYWEAYGRAWEPLDDVSLSAKDLNAPFSMNTHLHLMEAYANLLRVARDPAVELGCRRVLRVMMERVVLPDRSRFGLFYSAAWERLDEVISPGHDIEGSWLLWETAEIIGDPALLAEARPTVLAMADHTLAIGVDSDGGLLDEIEAGRVEGVGKSWWPQAEAAIGFLNAYQMTSAAKYLNASRGVWDYIERMIVDHENGEWFSGRTAEGRVLDDVKASPWKSSYHNGRMGFELMERLESMLGREDGACV